LKLSLVISLFFVFFIGIFGYAQTYNYTYSDPCTGNLQTIVVPINGEITVGYYGFTETFSYNDFTGGGFETWASGIFAQYNGNSPCSEIVGIGTTVDVTQSTALNVIGILNSLTTIADLAGTTNILGGSIGSISNSPGGENNNDNENKNNGNSNVNNNSNNSSGTGSNVSNSSNQNQSTQQGSGQGGTETGGSQTSGSTEESSNTSTSVPTGEGSGGETSTTSGGEGTGTEGNGSQQQGSESQETTSNGGVGSGNEGNQTQENPQTTSEENEGKTNITAGATNTTKAAGGKEGGKPSVVASSDFVGFNFRNSEVNYGAKATGGYTALRWDGQRSWGGLADYTSALKGPNITGFYAWIKPRSIALASSTLTVGFEGNKSVYGTLAGGQMFTFPKIPRLKVLYMGTVSYGFIYREQFIGTAVIAGAMYDMKLGKRIDIKLMNLMVYSPYVSYYNDLVLQSPYVMLPSIGTNIGITKRFKFNINGGGAWDLKTAALNYTVTCGTRLLIGQ